MVRESDPYYAVVKGALIKPAKEECALGMVQWPDDAELKDALIKLAKEERAGGRRHRARHQAANPNEF